MLNPLNRLALLVAIALPTCCLGGETLCKPKEKVHFSCTVGDTGKMISLCGNSLEDGKNFWLQYRFGTADKIELVYPKTKKLFLESEFEVRRTRMAKGFDMEVSFYNGGWSYTVFVWPISESSEWSGVRVARDRNDIDKTPLKCSGGFELSHYNAFSELVSRYGNVIQ